MSSFNEMVSRFNHGVDTYNPPVTGRELFFQRLKNLQPRFGRQVPPFGLTLLETLGDEQVLEFAYYTNPIDLYSSLYAVTETSIYYYDFVAGGFDDTPIYTGFPPSVGPVVTVPWYDRVYITKKLGKLVKCQAAVATEVENAPGARYGVNSNSHLMLAYLTEGSAEVPTRVKWSDLYEPEVFEILSSNEADAFDMEATDESITGLSYQRGVNLIYTRNSVWTARYNPLPIGYRFEPLFTGIGNLYHGAQVRLKEIDLFIGEDNIYVIDGLQLSGIGDPIWAYFKEILYLADDDTLVKGHIDTQNNEIFWVFPVSASGRLWSIVYNYKEGKWSDRDPLGMRATLRLKFPLRGFIVIDDVPDTIDTVSDLIDGDWQYPQSNFTELIGDINGQILRSSGEFGKTPSSESEGVFNCEAHTFEMYFDELDETDEVNAMTLFYAGAGDPDVQLLVGVRKNRKENVTWSPAILITDQIPGETTFNFRNHGAGVLIQFRLIVNNTSTDYVSEFSEVSLHHLENEPDDPN